MIELLTTCIAAIPTAPVDTVDADSARPALVMAWFLLMGILLGGYAVLDGFDLGVGILHPFVARSETERRLSMNSIGPLWDGNEVWLITFGGALFAMFPYAYATIFSGFYTAFMLLLFALIFRAVSLEFRGKMKTETGRRAWDWGFFAGSGVAALLFGVAIGNGIRGVGLDETGTFTGGVIQQLHPYNLAVGLMTVGLLALHGCIYLHLKTEGTLARRTLTTAQVLWIVFVALFVIVTVWTLVAVPRARANLVDYPILWVVPVLNVLAVANIGRCLWHDWPKQAFVSSCASTLAFVFLFMAAIFPNMVTGLDPSRSLSMYDSASSNLTLVIGLIIVAIGIPLVMTYTAIIYWTFRGKVTLEASSY